MEDKNLPPLPPEIEEQMRALRAMKPSDDLVERAFKRASSAAAIHSRGQKQSPRAPSRVALAALFAVPALVAITSVSLYRMRGQESADSSIERSSERSVDLPVEGHVWTDLDLQTHHHADKQAVVHVEVPETVRVALPGADGGAQERHCTEARCVHRFTQRHGHVPPLRVAVAHPGRYEIHVRHESNEARVRERFVLTAQRD